VLGHKNEVRVLWADTLGTLFRKMNGWMDVWMDEWMDGCVGGRMNGWIDVWMDEWMDG